MNVREAIEARRARRGLDAKQIDGDSVRRMMRAIRISASCFNNQPWRIIFVMGDALDAVKKSLSRGNAWAMRSPLILVVTANIDDDCTLPDRRDYYQFDCGLAVGQMVLTATEMGIIAHPIAGYKPDLVREALSIPSKQVIITLVICGYPSEDLSLLSEAQVEREAVRPPRKPDDEIFFLDEWGKPFKV